MKNILYLLLIICISSCSKEDKRIDLDITEIELNDIGQVRYEFGFESIPTENGLQRCKIRTVGIKKDNTIKEMMAYKIGSELNIIVYATPHDFDCNDISCLTVHDLYFNLNGLDNGKEYTVVICVNGVYEPDFNHTFKSAKL